MSENSKFFAMISRMKYINRWALMRNTLDENISEHSLETAFIAHALALIGNKKFGKNYNAERSALLAMFHDTTEIITGDLPTPVKYYNPEIKGAYKEVENQANRKMLSYLPDYLKEEYEPLFYHHENDKELWVLVKAADKLSALIKCLEERQMGNTDFIKAERSAEESIKKMNLPEVGVFMEDFIPAYKLTLDEQA